MTRSKTSWYHWAGTQNLWFEFKEIG